jgi:hypothetical protein
MSWTHNICQACWNKRNPGREAISGIAGEKDTCCFCDKENQDAIYLRANPNDLDCNHAKEAS